jgi:UDP-2,3-diacylglucosamine hydrolase
LGAHEVLTEALAPSGLLGRVAPDAQAGGDIARGVAVARALGAVDVGQGCVVQQGLVLAVETIEGTDAMLARAGQLRRDGPGGVLVKLVKPGQDRRVDLPALGAATVAAAAAAGLRGIAYSASGALIADRAATVAAADAAGMFLIGLDPEAAGEGDGR